MHRPAWTQTIARHPTEPNMPAHDIKPPHEAIEPSRRAPFDFSKLKARWAAEEAEAVATSARLLTQTETRAAPVLRRFGADQALIFGSVADGKARNDSDIDLLVLGTDPTDYWSLRRELEAALERPLDLYTEVDDPIFTARVRESGRIIYERQV